MNPDRPIYARVTIGSQKIDLSKSPDLRTFIIRLTEQMGKSRLDTDAVGIVEYSFSSLPHNLTLDRETQLMHEMKGLYTPDDEEVFPGVTAARAVEAYQSESFKNYQLIAANPDKRIGLSNGDIDLIKSLYFEEFPDVADHIPPWSN